ncbi:MAG: hypothetical protein ACFB14_10335 [Leptolyngbyaceae cyanobacterium]
MQPFLFIRALPYVTVQLSTYGASFFKRPVIWMALGFHGLLLVLPAIDLTAPKAEEVAEPEPEEEVSIEAVSLSDILAPTEPAPLPPEPETPPPENPPPATIAPPVLTDVPEQQEQKIIEEQDDPAQDEFEDEFEDNEQSFAFDPAHQSALSSSLSQFLSASNEGTSNFDVTAEWLRIDPTNAIDIRFREHAIGNVAEPSAFFTPESISNGTYLPFDTVTFKQIARNIDLVSREGLGQALAQAGMLQVDEGPYGGHPFYGVYSADGNPVNYISLIDLKGTTLVFVWPNDPRQG